MTTVDKARAAPPAAPRGRPGPPAGLTVWSLYALAALVVVVTIVMIVHSGAATCTGAASVRAAQHHVRIPACAPARTNPVPGRR